ncbi:uncharacterized protein C1orf131 homolog [Fundulus heteroclitus]|uniref:uncharacterized protein C1orf131 homolog n=1 Tax=Fundulus heteroclitus TaxID=8078 RepID=UPI00165A4F5B|nr:uncharacterized protein C1orf131 homolog [Fundulus heteroclitus]XP_021163382.2 uncharacterized protein C1orf131 homolog [Fundulus heteroclitus]
MSSETHEGKDEDCVFLERVLDSLYDFGSETKQRLKTQKKKKRKRCEEQEEEGELQALKETCSDSEDSRDAEVHSGAEQQPPNPQLKGQRIQLENKVEVVTFQDPRKKMKTKQTPVSTKIPVKSAQDAQKAEQKQISQQEQLSLEKARLEVHRFGITGYKKEQQRVFEQDRAIMLGARPPKKGYVNYKVLQEQITEKKQKAKEEFQPDKKKKKKSNQKDKKKPSSSGSGVAPSGLVGRFKNGMLILSSKEIQKIKSNK